jgi:ATP-binding cassette subfamily F protein uup
MQDPGFYQQPGAAIAAANAELAALQTEVDEAYRRWQELDAS